MSRSGWIAALIGSFAVVLFIGGLHDGGLGIPDAQLPQDEVQTLRDIQVVWIAERAFLAGMDPSLPVGQLADALDVPRAPGSILEFHPRAPAAYILEAWVALFPAGFVGMFGLIASALGLFLVVGLTGVLRGRAVPLAFFPLLALTDIIDSFTFWRSTSWMVSVSVLGCWILIRNRDDVWGGLALVPAICLRLWPMILIPVLWVKGRRRSAIAAAVGSLLLNFVALGWPNVSVESALRVLTEGKTEFLTSFGNGSLWTLVMRPGGPASVALGISIAVVLGIWVGSRKMSTDRAFGWAIVAGLLAVPVSWSHFRLALAPLVIHPFGLVVWAMEFTGRIAFEWRWVTGLLATLSAGIIWHLRTGDTPEPAEIPETRQSALDDP